MQSFSFNSLGSNSIFDFSGRFTESVISKFSKQKNPKNYWACGLIFKPPSYQTTHLTTPEYSSKRFFHKKMRKLLLKLSKRKRSEEVIHWQKKNRWKVLVKLSKWEQPKGDTQFDQKIRERFWPNLQNGNVQKVLHNLTKKNQKTFKMGTFKRCHTIWPKN